jgi:hypothetical protein
MHFSKTFLFLAAAVAVVTRANAFSVVPSSSSSANAVRQTTSLFADVPDTPTESTAVESENGGRPEFEFSFEIPKKGISDVGTAEVRLPPVLEKSELVIVRYDLPFGLNAEPDTASGQVVVTKDGKSDGGEKVGDILRQTTYWRGQNPGLFDVSKNADNFDLVVQALVTNDLAVADEIVLVFERPL